MIKKFFVSFIFFFTSLGFSQEKRTEELPIFSLKNRVRLNYTSVVMPRNTIESVDKYMGIGTLHYLTDITQNLYVGTNTHFALFGDQGGLFTLGVEAGITGKIYKNWFYDANFDFGGGGGYRNVINKGAYINPNIGISYHFKKLNVGLQYSHLNFYTGHIKDNSISAFIEIPTTSYYTSYSKRNSTYNKNALNQKEIPFRKSSFIIKFDQYLPFGSSKKDFEENFAPLTNTLHLVGFEYQKYLSTDSYVFFHTDAIYSGLVAGFMDIFGGFGFEPIQTKKFAIFTKLALGSAGGRIKWEGGITLYPSLGIDYHLNNKFSLSLHGGYNKAIDDGIFEAYTLGGGIKWNHFSGTTSNQFNSKEVAQIKTKGMRIGIQHQTYFKIPRRLLKETDLHLISLEVKKDINNTFYIVAQASFAYETTYRHNDVRGKKGAGGYADGMVGIGIYSPIFANGKIQPFADILAGAGGGAGIDTGQGIISKIRLGSYFKLNSYLSFMISGGKVISPFGNVNSNNVNVGLSVDFSTLKTLFK